MNDSIITPLNIAQSMLSNDSLEAIKEVSETIQCYHQKQVDLNEHESVTRHQEIRDTLTAMTLDIKQEFTIKRNQRSSINCITRLSRARGKASICTVC